MKRANDREKKYIFRITCLYGPNIFVFPISLALSVQISSKYGRLHVFPHSTRSGFFVETWNEQTLQLTAITISTFHKKLSELWPSGVDKMMMDGLWILFWVEISSVETSRLSSSSRSDNWSITSLHYFVYYFLVQALGIWAK